MGNNEYVIRIVYDSPTGGNDTVGDAPIATGGSSSGSASAQAKPTPGVSAASVLTPFFNTGMQMKTQEINTVTGSGQLAQKQALKNSMMRSVMDASMNALGGAGVAASLGLAAGPIGAAVGVAMSAVSKLLEISTNAMDLRNKQTVENASISATRARASISWDRSRER